MSIACFTISLQNGGLLSSENQSCFDGCDWFKVCLKEKMWLVDSQCGIVGILLNFHMWTGVKISGLNLVWNFSYMKFFIHEISVNFLSGMFNLVPHVKFLICIHFKHVSGVNQVWNRPDLMRIFCTGCYSGIKGDGYTDRHMQILRPPFSKGTRNRHNKGQNRQITYIS